MNRRERRAFARQMVRRQPGQNGADLQRLRSKVARDLAFSDVENTEKSSVLTKPFKGLRRRKSGLIAPE